MARFYSFVGCGIILQITPPPYPSFSKNPRLVGADFLVDKGNLNERRVILTSCIHTKVADAALDSFR